jgi:hypothetical protein
MLMEQFLLNKNITKNVMTTKFPNTISRISERWLSERWLECIVEIEVLWVVVECVWVVVGTIVTRRVCQFHFSGGSCDSYLTVSSLSVVSKMVSFNLTVSVCVCRCNERLKTKTEGSKLLTYTGFHGGQGHLKIETMLRGERFESVRGECVM